MIPIISVPSSQSSYSTAPVAAMASMSDVVLGRLPVASIAPSVNLADMNNNSRGNPSMRPAMQPQSASDNSQGLFNPGIASRVSQPTLNASASTLFLAQLFAQSDNAVSITGSTSQFIDYSTFVQYGMVKYRPSNAAMPRAETRAPEMSAEPSAANQLRMAAEQAARQLENANTVRQATPLVNAAPAASAGATMAQASAPQTEKTEARPQNATLKTSASRGGASSSLIRQRGVDAYMATFARNYANLNTPTTTKEPATEAVSL